MRVFKKTNGGNFGGGEYEKVGKGLTRRGKNEKSEKGNVFKSFHTPLLILIYQIDLRPLSNLVLYLGYVQISSDFNLNTHFVLSAFFPWGMFTNSII
ncbi:hypothetical protein Fmac_025584 [Flemingia macrophylla]|uniref:Uncharacterized protein n=1 Tax=Flemingia macrophylla TaxID=520843 RepID=A0ABD1LSR9_9FABA